MPLHYLIDVDLDGRKTAAESNRVAQSLGGIEKAASRIGGMLTAAFSFRSAVGAMQDLIKQGTEFRDLSQRIGVSAQKLQEWAYAAEQTGASANDITIAVRYLRVAIAQALAGPESDAAAAFDRMGITLDDLRLKKPEEIFDQLAVSMKEIPDSAQLTADAMRLLGRSADALMPAMRGGFDAMAKDARRFGLIMQDGIVNRLGRMGDAMTTLRWKWRAFKSELVETEVEKIERKSKGESPMTTAMTALDLLVLGRKAGVDFGPLMKMIGGRTLLMLGEGTMGRAPGGMLDPLRRRTSHEAITAAGAPPAAEPSPAAQQLRRQQLDAAQETNRKLDDLDQTIKDAL